MLELVRLRALAAVAQHGSVTVAARELHYAQPSISHHLARLEADVGVPLTQRVGRRIRLTPAGELLARRAVEILGRIRSAEDELAAIAELRTGKYASPASSGRRSRHAQRVSFEAARL